MVAHQNASLVAFSFRVRAISDEQMRGLLFWVKAFFQILFHCGLNVCCGIQLSCINALLSIVLCIVYFVCKESGKGSLVISFCD